MTDTVTATRTQTDFERALQAEIARQKARAARRIGGPPPGFNPEAEARKVLAKRKAWLEKKRAEEAARRANPLYPELQRALAEANRLRAENTKLREQIEELKRAMIDQDNARKVTPASAIVAYGDSDEVKQLAGRLQAFLPNSKELGKTGLHLVAQVAILHGLDPMPGSDHLYAWYDKKKGELVVTIGYKGLIHLARRELAFTHTSRPMTEQEREEHGLREGWIGYVTELYELAKAAECKQIGIPYHPVVGTAVWKPGDRVPAARTPAWVAKKNSLKDALRQVVTTGQRLQSALDMAAVAQAANLVAASNDQDDAELRVALPGPNGADGNADQVDQVIEGQLAVVPTRGAQSDPSAPSEDAAQPEQSQRPDAAPPAQPVQAPLFVDVERSDAYRSLVDAEAGQ